MNNRWYEPKRKRSLGEILASARQSIAGLFGRGSSRPGRGRGGDSAALDKFKTRLINWTLAFGHWFQLSVLPVLRRFDWRLIQGMAAVLVVSFFLANSISTLAANGILSITRSAGKQSGKKAAKVAVDGDEDDSMMLGNVTLGSPATANSVAIKKEILQRNLFNSEGKLAPEAGKDEPKGIRKDLSIDFENVPCSAGELPVQINGTIYTGDPKKSFVILKDPKIPDADIYKPGDAVIDHEDYEIYKVERGSLEVRKGNSKICVAISGYKKVGAADVGSSASPSSKVAGESKEFEFDAAFISQEIGPGYATILNCAKLIPEIDSSGKMQGFKMISIATSCLFDRIQIQNGDVLTEVNGISLKDAGQGFKLYQSLQEERTTTINILRNGEPITRTVRVK
jgi:type II secretory pathway component PulC